MERITKVEVAPFGRNNCLGRPCLGTTSSLSLTSPRLGLPEPARATATDAPKSTLNRTGKSLRGQIAAAVLALLAAVPACGGSDPDKPEPLPPVCETSARGKGTAPNVEIADPRVSPFMQRGDLLRVHFTVPEFDAECEAPLQVSVKGRVIPLPGKPQPQDAYRPLNGAAEVWEAGDDFVDVEMPKDGTIPSFRLHVEDAQGDKHESPSVSL